MRHCRPAQCWQIDPFQRADQNGGCPGGQLSVLHHRAEHRRCGGTDPRLDEIAAIAQSKEIIPTRITFVDIAGLVRGAASGEGLGNQFLANIREVDAIVHVVRCFEDEDITHVDGKIEPLADIETIETELMLADLESLEKRVVATRKKASGKDKEALTILPIMEQALEMLQNGKPARLVERSAEEEKAFQMLNLLTSKPILYVCNVEEDAAGDGNAYSAKVEAYAKETGARSVVISAAIEAEVAVLPQDEHAEFLETLGLEEAGLDRLIREGYALLGLVTYFTAGPKKRAPGPSPPAPRRRRPLGSSTPILNAASSGRRPLPMTTMSR